MSKKSTIILVALIVCSMVFNCFLYMKIKNEESVRAERVIDNFQRSYELFMIKKYKTPYEGDLILSTRVVVRHIRDYMEDIQGNEFYDNHQNFCFVLEGISIRDYKKDEFNLLADKLVLINMYLEENKEEFIRNPRLLKDELTKPDKYLNTVIKEIEAIDYE